MIHNIYTGTDVAVAPLSNVGFGHVNLETLVMHYAGALATMKKIALAKPPTRLGKYADFRLIAVFDIAIAMTQSHLAGNAWYVLPAACLYPYKYEAAMYHACQVFAVTDHGDCFVWFTFYGMQ